VRPTRDPPFLPTSGALHVLHAGLRERQDVIRVGKVDAKADEQVAQGVGASQADVQQAEPSAVGGNLGVGGCGGGASARRPACKA
jgi:hypothetical protein